MWVVCKSLWRVIALVGLGLSCHVLPRGNSAYAERRHAELLQPRGGGGGEVKLLVVRVLPFTVFFIVFTAIYIECV